MKAKEADGSFLMLQLRLINVEVHAIDAFDFESHMIPNDVGDVAR
jgi:hypothetical protein